MRLQVLVSAVNQEGAALAERMHLESDAVVINQTDHFGYEEYVHHGKRIQCYSFQEKGVGLSRNNALLRAEGDIVLFSDEDIVYDTGYEQRVHIWNAGRYPTYSFAVRREKLHAAHVTFSLLFGGGAKYSNGEDSLFLKDCLRYGLSVYAVPVEIGAEQERESTWFRGYTDKFFMDRGVLYHFLYGRLAYLMAVRFIMAHASVMCVEISRKNALALMRKGIKSVKGL